MFFSFSFFSTKYYSF